MHGNLLATRSGYNFYFDQLQYMPENALYLCMHNVFALMDWITNSTLYRLIENEFTFNGAKQMSEGLINNTTLKEVK